MFRKYIITVFVMSGLSGVFAGQSLTVDQYIGHVLNHNKNLKLAEKDKELASVQKKQALSTALPMIGFESGYTRNLTDYYMYFDMSALNPEATGVVKAPVKRDNEWSASVALQQTLFSPNVGSAIKAARQYAKLTDEVYEASEQAVVSGAKKVFYQVLLIEKMYDVMQAAEKNAKENYDQVKLKYDNGQVSKFELLQAETRWRSAVPETQKAERNLQLIQNAMKHLAGFQSTEIIDLQGKLKDVPALPSEAELSSVLEQRPDFKAMLWEEKLRETNVGAAKGAFLPTLTGTMAYAYSAQSNEFELDEENKLWFAGVTLSVPIFTGGYRSANVQKAKVELNKSRLNIEKTREDIENELISITLRLKEAHFRIQTAETVLETAKQGYEIAETTAYNGLATQLQLKDARVGFDQATLNYHKAVYDYLEAYFDYQLATGRVEI